MTVGRLPDFALERFFAQWEFRARHLLCASDVEALSLAELTSMMAADTRELWADLRLGYTEAAGHPLLRQEIAALYDTIGPQRVLVHAGAQEAIFAFCSTVFGPGDHVVVVWPAYQSLYQVAAAAGADVELVPLSHDEQASWYLDLDRLRTALRPDTRAIIVNFPHNPTGALPSLDDWREIIALAEQRGAWLFSDEVYRGLEHDAGTQLPPAVDMYERALSLGVMSKSFALAGLRIGWVAAHDSTLLDRMSAFKDYLSICPSAPAEVLAIAALRAREPILQRSREIVLGNLARLQAFFARIPDLLMWLPPRGGSVAFPQWLGDGPVERFTDELLQAEGVLLLPGTLFQHPGNHFRLGYGRRNLLEGLAGLEAFLTRSR